MARSGAGLPCPLMVAPGRALLAAGVSGGTASSDVGRATGEEQTEGCAAESTGCEPASEPCILAFASLGPAPSMPVLLAGWCPRACWAPACAKPTELPPPASSSAAREAGKSLGCAGEPPAATLPWLASLSSAAAKGVCNDVAPTAAWRREVNSRRRRRLREETRPNRSRSSRRTTE